jgi:hypothetical protein
VTNQDPTGTGYIDLGLEDPDKSPWDGHSSSVEPGEYGLEVVDAVVGTSGGGNPTLRVDYKVVDQCPMKERRVSRWYVLNPDNVQGCRRVHNLIRALNAPTDERMRFKQRDLIGLRMRADVVAKPYTVVDSRTGSEVKKMGSDIIGERPYEEYVEPQPQPQMAPQAPQQYTQQQPPMPHPQQYTQQPPRPQPQQYTQAQPAVTQAAPPPPQNQQPAGQPVASRRPGNQQPRVR